MSRAGSPTTLRKRFEAYGWQVIADVDGHDSQAIDKALLDARADKGRPTLICCKTRIGLGSPNKVGTHDVHGAPLGAAEIAAARSHHRLATCPLRDPRRGLRAVGWPHARQRVRKQLERPLRQLSGRFSRTCRRVFASHAR
jgi:transketolase